MEKVRVKGTDKVGKVAGVLPSDKEESVLVDFGKQKEYYVREKLEKIFEYGNKF